MSVTASPALVDALYGVSWAALVDLYLQQLSLNEGSCDEPVSIEALKEDANPMLRMRGDREIK